MPRYRKLHTKIVESFDFNDMPDDFHRLFWIMLPCVLSSEGTLPADLHLVRSKVFPLRADVTLEMVERALDWFAEHDMIRWYQAEGRRYLWATNFAKYQGNTTKEAESDYPPVPEAVLTNSGPTPDLLRTNSSTDAVCSIQMQYADADAAADRNNGGGSPLPDRDEYGPTNEPGGPTQMTSEEQKAVAKMWQDKMGSLCPPKILMYIGPEMRKYDGIHGHSALEWGLTVLEEAIASTTNPMGPNEKYMSAIFANWNLNGWRAPPGQRESKRDEIAETREKAKATRQQMLAQGVPRAEVDATIVEFYGEGY